jgi:hypothetical protein
MLIKIQPDATVFGYLFTAKSFYMLAGSASIGRTTCQPVLTTSLQPRHIPTQGYNITQPSAPDDGHMVARNMLSNY